MFLKVRFDTWPEHSFCVFCNCSINSPLSNSRMIAWFCSWNAFYIKCFHSVLALWTEAFISVMKSILLTLSVAHSLVLNFISRGIFSEGFCSSGPDWTSLGRISVVWKGRLLSLIFSHVWIVRLSLVLETHFIRLYKCPILVYKWKN